MAEHGFVGGRIVLVFGIVPQFLIQLGRRQIHLIADGAIIVNPYDVEGIAAGLQEALTMPLEERRARWEPMAEGLRKNDVTAWRKSFLAALSASRSEK